YADIRFAQDDDLDTLDERGLLRGPVRESLVPRGPLLLEDDRSKGGDGTLFVGWAAEEGVPHGGEVDNVFEGDGFEPLPPEVSAVFVSLEEDTCRYQKTGLSPVPSNVKRAVNERLRDFAVANLLLVLLAPRLRCLFASGDERVTTFWVAPGWISNNDVR